MSPDRSRAALLAALLVAAAVATAESLTEGYWGDELWTVRFATLPYGETVAATAGDVHPPLYYLLVTAWTDLVGVSPLAVRLPSVVFGVGTVALTAALATRAYDRGTGAVAAVLAALSVPVVLYAAEARMYALLTLLSVASYLCLWRLAVEGWDRRTVAVYAAASVGLCYTHVYGAILLAAQLPVLALLTASGASLRPTTRTFWRRWPLLVGAVGATFLPWLAQLAAVAAAPAEATYAYVDWIARADASYLHLLEWLGRPYPVWLLAGLVAVAVVGIDDDVGGTVAAAADRILSDDRGTGSASGAPAIRRSALPFRPRAALSALRTAPDALALPDRPQTLFFGGWYVSALGIAALLSALVRPIFYYRFCVPLAVPLLVLAARGVVRIRPRALAAVVLAVLVATGGAGAATLLGTDGKAPLDDAMAHVEGNGDGDDAAYVEFWGPELRALYGTPDGPERVDDPAHAVGDADRLWVVVSEDRSVPGIEPERTAWTRFAAAGPFRSYYEGERVWWVGEITEAAATAAP